MDFTQLTDEQLLTLLQEAMRESLARGSAVADAARQVLLSEKEAAEVASAASERTRERLRMEELHRVAKAAETKTRAEAETKLRQAEKDKIAKQWIAQKAQAQLIVDALGDAYPEGTTVNIWNGTDKRVYLDCDAGRRSSHLRAILYVDGNNRNAPGSFTLETIRTLPTGKTRVEVADQLKGVLTTIGKYWKSCKFNVDESLAYEPAQ